MRWYVWNQIDITELDGNKFVVMAELSSLYQIPLKQTNKQNTRRNTFSAKEYRLWLGKDASLCCWGRMEGWAQMEVLLKLKKITLGIYLLSTRIIKPIYHIFLSSGSEIFISSKLSRTDTSTFIILEMKIIHDILFNLISHWSIFMSMEWRSPDFKQIIAIIWLKSEWALNGFFFFFFW